MKTVSFEALKSLRNREGGLLSAEVLSQRSLYGKNDIVETAANPWLQLAVETLKDPMIWFLIGIGSILFITGETVDGMTILIAVLPLLLMDAFLHWRTQASTQSLRGQLSARARVLREGQQIEIDSREIVPGDVVVIMPGILLPADGIFESAQNVQTDESVLTGESLPISKRASSFDVFSLSTQKDVLVPQEFLGSAGTKVLTGKGLFRVLLTGSDTSYGQIVQSISQMPNERTPLQKSINRLVQILIFVSLTFCLLLATIRMYQGHGWLDALMSAATLAIAAIPEEFPVVFTFFLGVGIYRLAKQKALVRRAVSVENIGRVTQICTDKTGTITVGHLTLTHLDPCQGATNEDLLSEALAASTTDSDPLDIAISEASKEKNLSPPKRFQIYPFTEGKKREVSLIRQSNGSIIAFMKGAPETVIGMSTLSESEKFFWRTKTSEWAQGGHKVIAIARKEISNDTGEEPNSNFLFRGLLAFEDPHRPEVVEAMSYCHRNKIRVLMITGDHPETAAAIARDANLAANPSVVSAEDEPLKFEESWLNSNPDFLKKLNVVARCTPIQKLRIVSALKRAGELVAVTGDGVNDVPALKAADIGIAMGERGTRSAKEVSSIILADDNFATIINAIREGRQLFSNLKMSFEYLLLIHIPLVLTAALLPLAGYPLVYLPVHIVWLELVLHPTALLGFQGTELVNSKNEKQKSFFSGTQILMICTGGLLISFAVIFSFLSGLQEGLNPDHARAQAIAILTLWSAGVTAYLTSFRLRTANIIMLLTLLSSIVLIQLPLFSESLHVNPLSLQEWFEVSSFVALSIVAIFLVRRISMWRSIIKA